MEAGRRSDGDGQGLLNEVRLLGSKRRSTLWSPPEPLESLHEDGRLVSNFEPSQEAFISCCRQRVTCRCCRIFQICVEFNTT